MFRTIQSWLKPTAPKSRRNPPLTVTALEAREVPAVLSVTLAAASTVLVRPSGANVDVVVNGAITHRVAATLVEEVRVTGSNDADSVLVSDPRIPVAFDGRDGIDTLRLDRSMSTADTKYQLGGYEDGTTLVGHCLANGATRAEFVQTEKLFLTAGSGDDTVDATGVPPRSIWWVDGGGHRSVGDTYTGSNRHNYFTLLGSQWWGDGSLVSGPNQGLHNQSAFKSFENLLGNTRDDGSDKFIVTAGGSLTGWIDGAGGLPDTLSYSQDNPDLYYAGYATGVTVDLQLNRATAIGRVNGIENVIGSAFADVIYGNSAANVLDGRGGNDCVYGGAGNDTLVGGAGNDLLDDNDPLFGGGGNDDLYGGEGNDTLYGRDGSDVLYGEAGDDQMYGGAGYDRAYGGLGIDTLDPDIEYRNW